MGAFAKTTRDIVRLAFSVSLATGPAVGADRTPFVWHTNSPLRRKLFGEAGNHLNRPAFFRRLQHVSMDGA